jgi:hypothetical protein
VPELKLVAPSPRVDIATVGERYRVLATDANLHCDLCAAPVRALLQLGKGVRPAFGIHLAAVQHGVRIQQPRGVRHPLRKWALPLFGGSHDLPSFALAKHLETPQLIADHAFVQQGAHPCPRAHGTGRRLDQHNCTHGRAKPAARDPAPRRRLQRGGGSVHLREARSHEPLAPRSLQHASRRLPLPQEAHLCQERNLSPVGSATALPSEQALRMQREVHLAPVRRAAIHPAKSPLEL